MILTGTIYLNLCRFCQRRTVSDTKRNQQFICKACHDLPAQQWLELRDKTLVRELDLKYKKD